MPTLTILDLGPAPYLPTLSLQRRLVAELVAAPSADAQRLLLEHDPPVITLGRRGRAEDILAPAEALAAAGVEVHRVTRGGEATYHGPGQLVAYPILHLRRHRLTLRAYVGRLEDALIETVRRFGVPAGRRDGQVGVWVGDGKIAAVGVAVERFVTYHGAALNVSTDLSAFDWIVPCGVADQRVTSLARLAGREVDIGQVKAAFARSFADAFHFETVRDGSALG